MHLALGRLSCRVASISDSVERRKASDPNALNAVLTFFLKSEIVGLFGSSSNFLRQPKTKSSDVAEDK